MNQSIEVSQAQVRENSFFSQVYLWMAGGLLASAASAYWVVSTPPLLKAIVTNPVLLIGMVIAELVLVFTLSAAINRLSFPAALGMFGAYSVLNGMTLSFILLVYTGASVAATFAITAGTFICFSVYGYATKADLTKLGQIAFLGLIGIIIASVVNIFLKSPAMYWVITYAGILVFMGLIVYDTQRLKAICASGSDSAEGQSKMALLGALILYLDFINLFLLLLRLFGRRND